MERKITLRRLVGALAASCALAAPAVAQQPQQSEHRLRAELRAPPGGEPGRMLALVPMGEDAVIGLGRFSIVAPPRPRSHVERERDPTDIRRRERGIGGFGLRVVF